MRDATGTLAIPYYRFLEGAFLDSLSALDVPDGWIELKRHGFQADRQRNWLVEHFKGEWLFFVDSDNQLAPKTLMRLLESGMPVVGGCYYKRGEEFEPVNYLADGKDANGVPQYRSPNREIVDYLKRHREELDGNPACVLEKPALRERDAVGTGCLLIRRDVFEKIEPPYFAFTGGGTEDLYFCRKVKAAGIPILVDLSVQVGHWQNVPVGYGHFLAKQGVIK